MTSRTESRHIVKTDFDFGWKRWRAVPELARKVLELQKGDVLDIGCATCQLATFLRENGWKGKYTGVDIERYEGYEYPEGVELMLGDALQMDLPKADTVVLYDVLGHVSDPVRLLAKAIDSARRNVLVSVPLRNEEMWALGVVEPHQLDKTHVHCGFTDKEFARLVSESGGRSSGRSTWSGRPRSSGSICGTAGSRGKSPTRWPRCSRRRCITPGSGARS